MAQVTPAPGRVCWVGVARVAAARGRRAGGPSRRARAMLARPRTRPRPVRPDATGCHPDEPDRADLRPVAGPERRQFTVGPVVRKSAAGPLVPRVAVGVAGDLLAHKSSVL